MTDKDATSRPYARGRDRRDELLRAAAIVFARSGFQGTSMAAVASQAGMTDAGAFHHFTSKAELYRTVMEARITSDAVQHMVGPDSTLEETLESMIDYVRWLASQPTLLRFRAMVSGEALVEGNPASVILTAEHERALPSLVGKVSAAQSAGTIAADVDAQQVVLELFAINEGLRHMSAANPDSFDYGAVFERAARRWYDGLRA